MILKRRQFSLKRMMVGVLVFSVFCSLIKSASTDRVEFALVPAVLSLGLLFGVMTRRYVISLVAVSLLAWASNATSTIRWIGGFPFAELQISVANKQGDAISGAEMTVSRRAPNENFHRCPIAEYDGTPLVSDENGQIICHQSRLTYNFGGRSWLLFWCIPIGAQSPKYDVHFVHPEHGSKTVSIWRLFDSGYDFYDDIPKTTFDVNGYAEEMPIYKTRIEMPR